MLSQTIKSYLGAEVRASQLTNIILIFAFPQELNDRIFISLCFFQR